MTDSPTPADTIPPGAPWVRLRSASTQTFIYDRMVREAAPEAQPGDVVRVFDRHGALFGHALYNPKSRIALRMLNWDDTDVDEAFWRDALERAVRLRTDTLRLDTATNAYRLVHAEGDELSGLVVDRYGDVLSVEVFSRGIWDRAEMLLPMLHELAGTQHHRVEVDERVLKLEGFKATPVYSGELPRSVNITENGVRFRVDFATGHKTGFFCDQRENRVRLASLVHGANVLDVCCYSGGFGIYAKTRGEANEVTCVDLDEQAVEAARKNANLNQARVSTVHADAFGYMRQMHTNGRRFGVVVLDPPKLVFGKSDEGEGRKKYHDLNRLAAAVVEPGGVLLTCSCSGAVDREEFARLAIGAVRQAGRSCRILDYTGAGPDHPVSPRCAESAYLKALWLHLT
ncbi:MAG TPA: class I SAM-dependent rRNA methyltransferase [Phycisphaerae bacterium]|nr:class I SAM-dependent rRNA methyltransferase [Phycisphaerales bacterium]HRX83993.1 class I SAM-dependent rRNA methyltransferase [Phycisphaerae bacterium]